MNVSLDVNYFTAQMKNRKDKEIFNKYYTHFQIHLEHTKKYIEIKKEFYNYIFEILEQYKHNQIELPANKLIERIEIYNILYKDIEESIKLVKEDAMEYKNKFRDHLFYLIKK